VAHARGPARATGQAAPDRRDKNRNPPQQGTEEAEQLAQSMLRQHDSDGDGKLRLTDLLEEVQSRLQAADVNGDGFVDRAELDAVPASLRTAAGNRSKTRPKEPVAVEAASR
jgi:Ca2+-binding EF-hand superfamily protein